MKIFKSADTEELIYLFTVPKIYLFQLLFEQVIAASAAEHFSRIVVDEVLGFRCVLLGFILHAFSFWEMSAKQLIIIFVAAALMRSLRVAVERGHAESIQSCLVCKFAAVVGGQCFENLFEVTAKIPFQQLHCFHCREGCFICYLYHDFLPCHSFCEDKAGFFFNRYRTLY